MKTSPEAASEAVPAAATANTSEYELLAQTQKVFQPLPERTKIEKDHLFTE